MNFLKHDGSIEKASLTDRIDRLETKNKFAPIGFERESESS